MQRFWAALLGLVLLGAAAQAKPAQYLLDQTASTVGFQVDLGQSPLKGQMPVAKAELTLDFVHAAASRVRVTLDAAGAKMGLPFATEAMKGPQVLDTANFPQIVFESTRLRATGEKATVAGKITIRGVTRPITLEAQLFRPRGSAPGERDHLSIHLTGMVQRSDFGAIGFGDLVGDQVRLDITAHIHRVGAK